MISEERKVQNPNENDAQAEVNPLLNRYHNLQDVAELVKLMTEEEVQTYLPRPLQLPQRGMTYQHLVLREKDKRIVNAFIKQQYEKLISKLVQDRDNIVQQKDDYDLVDDNPKHPITSALGVIRDNTLRQIATFSSFMQKLLSHIH